MKYSKLHLLYNYTSHTYTLGQCYIYKKFIHNTQPINAIHQYNYFFTIEQNHKSLMYEGLMSYDRVKKLFKVNVNLSWHLTNDIVLRASC